MGAPFVFFGANIAAAEDAMVKRVFHETFDDSVFVPASEQAEVVNFVSEIFGDILREVAFEFIALGVLMIDGGTDDVALIGARFVG